ncbi:amino acid adenylation domain-containing protein [Phytohabitans kaempferiae]|uniref:Amino acid adenylation domain-containing protein n=1 Tax=Phytohabitans kaempferiae TaxID=1620943 RepID=A0ABV6LYR9_9ACTN
MTGSQSPAHSPVATVEPGVVATVPDLVRAQAERSPEAVAVESAGDRLTYAQLLAEAHGVAEHLRQAGVAPGDLAAVAVPRGVDLVPALLGVQLAGAAYVPLDPEHPADRLNYILENSGARVLVTADAAGARGLRVATQLHLTDVAVRTGPLPSPALAPGSAAYVIYTSGSTGRPKGVMVTHGAFANFIQSMRERPGLPDDVVLPAVTTVSFDIAGLELFLPLTTGGRVVVARQAETSDPRRLAALLASTGARVMQATPITWRLLLEAGWSPPPGFTVLCGGERLPAELADRLLGDQVVLWDLYGPTETTVWSSVTRYERGTPARFHPVRETSLRLLDEHLQPVPPETVGELYIGGTGLAAGYLGRAALTAARFVADPYAAVVGSRLYRTGDVARRHPDGRIEILGRSDDQIKIRGFRIEPGEIEHLLARHPQVAEAAVRAFGETDEATRLVGYIRPADPADPPDARRLQLHLARSAPAYMIPAQFVVLDEFPRTPNGKLNRAALPAPAESPRPTGTAEPAAPPAADARAGGMTERIAKIVAEVLERPTVGAHEDFFALGGDSLRAVQIILRLNEELATEVPINALFETRTVYGLAALLDADAAPEPQPLALPGGRGPRLSAAQWRLWLHQRSAPESTADNAPVVVRLPGPLDLAALESAVTGLLARHAILHTRYDQDESGLPVPVVEPPAPIRLAVEEGDPRAILAAELARPFDLAAGPPVRVRLVRRPGDDGALLLMVAHRIAADDRSGELIASQVRAAYRGRTVPAPPLGYGDFAEWQRELSASPAARRHLDRWRTTLAGLDTAELPADRPRPATRDWRAGTVRFAVPPAAVRALQEVAADHDATPFMGLLAGFYALLARRTGGTDLAVGVPVAGRDRPELEAVVGMLEETAVVRVDLGGRPSFGTLLARVREATLAAVDHAVLPFEDIVATTETVPAPGRNPLFDVLFALHGIPADPAGFPLPDPPGTRFDLCCHLTERPDGGVDGRLDYATQLFDEATVAGLADEYVRLLAEAGADPDAPAA